MRVVFLAAFSLLCAGCGVIGPKIDFYEPPPASDATATVRGSRTSGPPSLTPVTLILDSIDHKATGRAKAQRCNFDRPIPLSAGSHELLIVLSAGTPFAASRIGIGRLSVIAEPHQSLVIEGEVTAEGNASVWVTDATSRNVLTQRLSLTLGPSPSKGMPAGFALIEDSCGLP